MKACQAAPCLAARPLLFAPGWYAVWPGLHGRGSCPLGLQSPPDDLTYSVVKDSIPPRPRLALGASHQFGGLCIQPRFCGSGNFAPGLGPAVAGRFVVCVVVDAIIHMEKVLSTIFVRMDKLWTKKSRLFPGIFV